MFTVTQAAAKKAGAARPARNAALRRARGALAATNSSPGLGIRGSSFSDRADSLDAPEHLRERDDLRMAHDAYRRRKQASLHEIVASSARLDAADLEDVVAQPAADAHRRVAVAVDHLQQRSGERSRVAAERAELRDRTHVDGL